MTNVTAAGALDCSFAPGDYMSVTVNGDYQAQVSWEAVIDASEFLVYRDGALFKRASRADTTYLNTMLRPGVSYHYEVMASCQIGPKSLGAETIIATGPPKAPIARSSFSAYVSEGDSSAGGSYISPGPNESWARRYSLQVNDFFVGDHVPEQNEHAGGSYCRDYTNGGSKYGVMDRVQEKLLTPTWAQAQLVTIGVGTHELRTGTVSIEQYRDCMFQLAQMISPTPNAQLVRTLVYLTLTPDISGESLTNKHNPLRLSWNKGLKDAAYHAQIPIADAAQKFAEAEADAAAAGECTILPLTDGEVVPQCLALLQSDQAHPNWRGHDVMAQAVIDELMKFAANDFASRAVPGRPVASDFRASAPAAVGTIRFSWQPPVTPAGTALRATDTYEVNYRPAGPGSWTSVRTSSPYIDLPVPAAGAAPWWVKVRAFSSDGIAGRWSTFGHDTHLSPVEFFEETPHYRENDFIRDRSDMAFAWDARDLPNADPSKNCDDGCAYLIGGRGSSDFVSSDIYRFNPKSNRLTLIGGLKLNGSPMSVWGASAVWTGREILIIGGFQNTIFSNRIVRYDPVTGATSVLPATLPIQSTTSERAWMSAAWDPRSRTGCPEGCAYIFGGISKVGSTVHFFDQILRLDPTSNTLTQVTAKMPGGPNGAGRCCHTAVWDGARKLIYIFGGRVPGPSPSDDGVIVDDVLVYDPANGTIRTGGKLPLPTQYPSAIFDGTEAFVFGGDHDGKRVISDRIVKYSPATGTVTLLGQRLLSGRRLSAAVCNGDRAFILGGDWIAKYSIMHGFGVPPTLIGLASNEVLRFSGINKSVSGCEPLAVPYPPMITTPLPGAIQGLGGVVFKGMSEENTIVKVLENGIELGRTTTGSTSSWELTLPLGGGNHTLTAVAMDASGSSSAPSVPLTVLVDDVPPAAPVITSPGEGAILPSRNVSLSGTAEPSSTLKLVVGTSEFAKFKVAASGSWSTSAVLPGGPSVIKATATDAAGNVSATTNRNIDIQVPVASVVAQLPSKRWATAAIWDGRHRPGVNCGGGCAYIFGGDSQGSRLSDIVVYNPATNSQRFSSARLPAVAGAASAWTGRYVYLFGGIKQDGTYSNAILRFDVDTETVTTMNAPLPFDGGVKTAGGRVFSTAVWDPRSRPEAGCLDGCAYVFGGYYYDDGEKYVGQIVRYNPATDTATLSAAQLPLLGPADQIRCCLSAAWDGNANVAYLFGGQKGLASDVIFRFDPAADQLTTMPVRLPGARQIPAAVTDGSGTFYIAGGLDKDKVPLDEIVRYTPATGAMEVVAYLKEPLGGLSAVWAGNRILVFGGQTAAGHSSAIMSLTP